jgi:hypothetical protein
MQSKFEIYWEMHLKFFRFWLINSRWFEQVLCMVLWTVDEVLRLLESYYRILRWIKRIVRSFKKKFLLEWGTPTPENPGKTRFPGIPGKFSSLHI